MRACRGFVSRNSITPNTTPQVGRIAAIFLFVLGVVGFVRAGGHTFFIHWGNDTFAQLDLSTNGQDQLLLLGTLGISNWLTGMLYILIALKARALSEFALLIILVVYAVGWLGLQYAGVKPEAEFTGRYVMFVNFAVCAAGLIWSRFDNKRAIKTQTSRQRQTQTN